MYNSAFRGSLLFFSALMIRAPAQTAPSGVIVGIVLDAGSSSPLGRAVVTLSTVEAQPQDAVAWTDSNGRFSFGYLPPGGYMLRATKIKGSITARTVFAARRRSSNSPPAKCGTPSSSVWCW